MRILEGFLWDDINDAECLAEFRFRKHDLPLLAEVLRILDSFTCYQRTESSGMKVLCIILRRLSYPCRFSDIIPLFRRSVPVLSMVSNRVLDFIYDTHGHRITQWNHQVFSQPLLQLYSDAIAAQVLLWTVVLDLLMGQFLQFADLQNIREQSITATRKCML